MTITTVDQAIAGMKPPVAYAKALSGTLVAARPYTNFYAAGVPGAAVSPTPGLSGAALTSYAGQIPFPAASNTTYLARFSGVSSAQGGVLLLCDRLWHNSGITINTTALQTVNSVAFPARDSNGSTNGEQVLVGVEVSVATGSGNPTLTIEYTNSAGTPTRTATNTVPTNTSSGIGSFYPIGLQAGDTGVRSIQTFQMSASWSSGTIHLVAYRILATLDIPTAGIGNTVDVLTSGMPICYDNTVPFLLFIPQTTTTTQATGTVVFTQG